MKKRIVFRADGGNVYSVGMGHVYRCVRVAKEMSLRGIACVFIMRDYSEGIAFVREAGFEPVLIARDAGVEKDIETTISFVSPGSEILFIDLRTTKKELVREAMTRGTRTIVYEDISQEDLAPSVLFNPSPAAREEEYYRRTGVRYLLGEDFLVLDPVINRYKREGFSPEIGRIFLCFGGADPINLSSRVLKALLARNEDAALDLALGPAFRNFEEIDNIIVEMDGRKKTNVIVGNNLLPAVSVKADAAMTSGGTCLFEAISQNIPVLGLPTIYSEARIVSRMMEEGLADGIDRDTSEVSDAELLQKIDAFLGGTALREELYNSQIKKDLSGGLAKVADYLEALMNENERGVKWHQTS